MEIEKYLLNKGIKPRYKGFAQLTYAIELCQKEKTYLGNFTTRLYKDIARDFATLQGRVERDMRFALRSAGNKEKLSEFISMAVFELKLSKEKGAKK